MIEVVKLGSGDRRALPRGVVRQADHTDVLVCPRGDAVDAGLVIFKHMEPPLDEAMRSAGSKNWFYQLFCGEEFLPSASRRTARSAHALARAHGGGIAARADPGREAWPSATRTGSCEACGLLGQVVIETTVQEKAIWLSDGRQADGSRTRAPGSLAQARGVVVAPIVRAGRQDRAYEAPGATPM